LIAKAPEFFFIIFTVARLQLMDSDKFVTKNKIRNRIIRYEITGFALVTAVYWITGMVEPPYYLLKTQYNPIDVYEAIFVTFIIMLLCAYVVYWTRKIISEIKHLEGFMSICASCKNVRVGDRWVQIEEILSEKSDLKFSHGICPKCAERLYGIKSGNGNPV